MVNDPISQVDIFPTIAAYLHVELPDSTAPDGESFLNLLRGQQKRRENNRPFMSAGAYDPDEIMKTMDGWKLIDFGNSHRLFRQAEDIHEDVDLLSNQADPDVANTQALAIVGVDLVEKFDDLRTWVASALSERHPDNDADGMQNAYELANGLDPDSRADADAMKPSRPVTVRYFQAETSTDFNGTFDTISDNGDVVITGSSLNSLPAADPFTTTWTFTITNAVLDAVGGANDSITLDIELKSDLAGAGVSELIAGYRTATNAQIAYFQVGTNDPTRIDGDEVVTFTPGTVSYVLNGGAPQTGHFYGFTAAYVEDLGGGNALVGGETVSNDAFKVTFSSAQSVLTAGAESGASYRLSNISFQMGKEPEPDIAIITESPLEFGEVGTNLTRTLDVTVRNVGSALLSITNLTWGGATPGVFSVVSGGTGTLASGTSTNLSVQYAPTALVSNTAVLSIWSDDPDTDPTNITVQGEGVVPTPEIAVTVGSPLDFGPIPVNTTNSLDITVANMGTGPLSITNLTFSGSNVFSVTSGSGVVDVGASTNITAAYTPGANAGSHTGTLHIGSDDTDTPVTNVLLQGSSYVPTPDISIANVPPLDFGVRTVNTTNTLDLIVANSGTGPLSITNMTIDGSNEFSVAVTTGTVAAGGSTAFAVRYMPTGVGTHTGTLSVWSDDPDSNPTNIALSAQAMQTTTITWSAPEGIAANGDSVVSTVGTLVRAVNYTPSAGDNRTVNGVTFMAQTSVDPGWNVVNVNGDTYSEGGIGGDFEAMMDRFMNVELAGTLTVTGLTAGTVYSVQLFHTDIPNRGGDTITHAGTGAGSGAITHRPAYAVKGSFTASGVAQDIDMTGTKWILLMGYQLRELPNDPYIGLVPSSLDFGPRLVGSPHDLTVTVANTGGAALTVTNFTLTGSDAFAVLESTPFSLAAGNSTNVTVRYAPTGVAMHSGTLNVWSDAVNTNPATVTLDGEARATLASVVHITDFGGASGTPAGAAAASCDNGSVSIANTPTGEWLNNDVPTRPNPHKWTFTVTGANLDDDGNDTDTLTWQVWITATSTKTDCCPAKNANDKWFTVASTGENLANRKRLNWNETLTFTVTNALYGLNGAVADQTDGLTFAGFTGGDFDNYNTSPWTYGGDTFTVDTTDAVFSAPQQALSIFRPSGTGNAKPGNLNFEFHVQPPGGPGSDGDAILDAWELRYWGNTTTADDTSRFDTDPHSDLQEYIADTDPTDSNSFFRVTGLVMTNSMAVTFDSSTGRVYTLQFINDLLWPSWSNVPGQGPRLGLGTNDMMIDSSDPPQRSYRVEVSVPAVP